MRLRPKSVWLSPWTGAALRSALDEDFVSWFSYGRLFPGHDGDTLSALEPKEDGMAVAYVQEFDIVDGDTSTTNYDSIAEKLGNEPGRPGFDRAHRRLRPRRRRVPDLGRLGERRRPEALPGREARPGHRRAHGQQPGCNPAWPRNLVRPAQRHSRLTTDRSTALSRRRGEATAAHSLLALQSRQAGQSSARLHRLPAATSECLAFVPEQGPSSGRVSLRRRSMSPGLRELVHLPCKSNHSVTESESDPASRDFV